MEDDIAMWQEGNEFLIEYQEQIFADFEREKKAGNRRYSDTVRHKWMPILQADIDSPENKFQLVLEEWHRKNCKMCNIRCVDRANELDTRELFRGPYGLTDDSDDSTAEDYIYNWLYNDSCFLCCTECAKSLVVPNPGEILPWFHDFYEKTENFCESPREFCNYVLVDGSLLQDVSKDNFVDTIFYVGKGKCSNLRWLDHLKTMLEQDEGKSDRIRACLRTGLVVIGFGMYCCEAEALGREALIIQGINSSGNELTNKIDGHHVNTGIAAVIRCLPDDKVTDIWKELLEEAFDNLKHNNFVIKMSGNWS